MAYFFLHRDTLFEKIHIAHVNVFVAIEGPGGEWILLAKFRDDGLVDLHSDFSFDLEANWLDDFLCESSVYLLFIVVDANVWLLKMSDVPEHFDWVVHCHEEVVDLIWSLDVSHNHVEDERIETSDPVHKTAPRRFLYDFLPV